MEKFMLVERKKTLAAKALQVVMILLTIVSLVLTIVTWNPFCFLLTCVLVILTIVTIRKYTEFEYSYFDGNRRIMMEMDDYGNVKSYDYVGNTEFLSSNVISNCNREVIVDNNSFELFMF